MITATFPPELTAHGWQLRQLHDGRVQATVLADGDLIKTRPRSNGDQVVEDAAFLDRELRLGASSEGQQ